MGMALFVSVLLLIVFVGSVLLGVVLMLPAVSEAQERVRIEPDAQEASWRIHGQATRAFGQMLQASREAEREAEREDQGQ